MTQDEAAFLRTIREHPEADLPRLVFADWLRENGRELHADFIQQQIAGEVVTVPLTVLLELEPVMGVMPHQTDRRATPGQCTVTVRRTGPGGQMMPRTPPKQFIYRRGFFSELHAELEWIFGNLSELVAKWPITAVSVVDKEPYWFNSDVPSYWTWIADVEGTPEDFPDEYKLPQEVYWKLTGGDKEGPYCRYSTFAEAEADLTKVLKAKIAEEKESLQ